jgi:YVTN family beta-propeller protein
MAKLYTFLLMLLSVSVAFAQNYTDGIFVLNEGNAGSNGATISFITNNTVTNNIYSTVNPGLTLGDTGQSMSFYGDYAYIVLNVSNKIEIVNKVTLEHVASITTGLSNPRYMAFSNGKAFITNWGSGANANDDYLAVLNLETNTIESTIALAEGVERILEVNGKLYVAHQGGYSFNNVVSVVNPVTLAVEQTIAVGDVPNSMVVKDGILYVMCGGIPSWTQNETFGELDKIDLATNTVVSTIEMPSQHPQHLKAGDNNFIFYAIDGDIFKVDATAASLPAAPLFSLGAQNEYGIYGMDVIDNTIYVADAIDYASPGHVYIRTTDGAPVADYTVGALPNSFYKSAGSTASTNNPVAALKITVAPNPAISVFYLNTTNAATVKLYNLQGRLVKEAAYTVAGVNVEDMSAGLYIVEVATENAKSVQRLIIK